MYLILLQVGQGTLTKGKISTVSNWKSFENSRKSACNQKNTGLIYK